MLKMINGKGTRSNLNSSATIHRKVDLSSSFHNKANKSDFGDYKGVYDTVAKKEDQNLFSDTKSTKVE
jgi:hypothetical protein